MPNSAFGQRFNTPIGKALSDNNYQIKAGTNAIRDLNYKAFVVCHDENIIVDAWLPETLSVDVTANYDTPFAQGIGGDGNIAKVAKLAGVTLTTQALSIQVWQGGSYIQFSLPFIFQAENNGAADVMTPIKKLMRLMMPKETSPGGLLQAPGPRLDPKLSLTGDNIKAIGDGVGTAVGSLWDTAKSVITSGSVSAAAGKAINGLVKSANAVATPVSNAIVNSVVNNISLYIGQFQYFPCVIITDVSPTYDVILGPDLNPVRASVTVTFKTYYIPTQNDIETMFPSATDEPAYIGGNPSTSYAGPSVGNSAASRS
jgi:hypothetical protein